MAIVLFDALQVDFRLVVGVSQESTGEVYTFPAPCQAPIFPFSPQLVIKYENDGFLLVFSNQNCTVA